MLFRRNKTFGHGVHPPDSKDRTKGMEIRQFPFAPELVVPLSQHIGKPARPLVGAGQEVVRGQRIGEPDGYMSVAMHAPVSGEVTRIGPVPTIKGQEVPGVYLRPHPASTQEVAEGLAVEPTASREEILKGIQMAGVVGLGGAAFPTHVKLDIPEGEYVDTVIINGVECEPYLTTDHRVMLEQVADIYNGARYLEKVTGAERIIIGVEANKPDAADALRAAIPADLPIEVMVLEVKYPQGAEKMLISALLGREVPSGGFPYQVGAICINVATTAEIGRLLPHGQGIQERVVSISGPAVRDAGNYRIPIGTPLRFILDTVGVADDVGRVFMGGPMMGPTASNLDVPILKGTSGVVAFTTVELPKRREYPCIRCAYCVDACPLYLNPSQLGLLAKNREYDRMAEEFHLMDCFECGSCSYVCPSHIPLAHYFRVAKAAVRRARAKE
ncbi:MAG: electron transport complex subunit RsxC [Deltaproteobacteria bacterium]|nr:electron transport complex subunit RsxC [Deltaproteobacteria bacterium]